MADVNHASEALVPDIGDLESRLGFTFPDRSLLVQALTHRSYANESGGSVHDNEVLEFLGDAVLGLVVSDLLYNRYPGLSEGEMSKLKSFLVSAETLAFLANELGVGPFVLLGKGEEKTEGRGKNSILANTFEAVIAALYVAGGLDAARRFVLARIEPLLDAPAGSPKNLRDHKSGLQERAQADGLPLPSYRVTEEEGPDHAKVFHVEVTVGNAWHATGSGRTKKAAEQYAARRVLDAIAVGDAARATP